MPTVNIIGSGVIGLLTAHELLNEGYEVHLFDKGKAGQESTWAGGGIISPLFPWRYDDAITKLALRSQQLYPNILKQLAQFSPVDPEFINSGMLMLDCNDLAIAKQWQIQFNTNLHLLDKDTIHQQFNFLAEHFSSAAWMPDIYQIRNPRFARLLIDVLRNRGAILHENTEINTLTIKKNRVISICSPKQSYSSDLTVICSGAWTGDLLKDSVSSDEEKLPINPVHGQMLLLKAKETFFKQIILSDGRYIMPRSDGHILVGSTTEMLGYKKITTDSVKQQLLEYAYLTIPNLKNCKIVKHWSGLRPGSVKGIPTIAKHPNILNLFVNAGHYRNGLVTATASAELMRHLICQQKPYLNQSDYRYKT